MGNCCIPFGTHTFDPGQAIKRDIKKRKDKREQKTLSFSKLQFDLNENHDEKPVVQTQELSLVVVTPGGTEKRPEVIRVPDYRIEETVTPLAMNFEEKSLNEQNLLDKIEEATSKHKSLTNFLISEMEKIEGDKIALVDSESGKSYTYKQIITQIRTLAVGLQELGVRQGDVLCMCTSNNIKYPVVFCAVVLIGGVFQTANPLYTVDDLVRSYGNCSTKYVVTDKGNLSKMEEVKSKVNSLQKIILIDESDADLNKDQESRETTEKEDIISFQSLFSKEGIPTPVEIEDPKTTEMLLLSSSGTTGLPKAVKHSHYSIIASIVQVGNLYTDSVGSTCVLFLPMFHVYALVIITCTSLQLGMKLVVMPRFEPEKYLQLIATQKAGLLHVVPPVMIMLAKNPKVQEYDLSSVKTIISAAAPLSLAVEACVKERLGIPNTFQGYGLTEAPVIFSNSEDHIKEGSVGTALPGVQYKITDVETKEELGSGKNGEICIKGPQVTMGYLNNDKATSELIDQDGWMHTGDIGYIDEDGFLFIVDRLKELIKYKGFQVAPAELEDLLLQHPAVMDSAVVGVPDDEAGELPRAFIVKKPNSEVSDTEIKGFIDKKVAPHMKLRGGVEFLKDIPKNPSGKILRRKLKEKIVADLESEKPNLPG